ncbi:hypothetical protein [Streptomyces exfoliatus]|uniref:hypothetical protein n=1 Tax=Streptomyces exfoliatus TaxID=1905 RepID=UPI0037AA1DEC
MSARKDGPREHASDDATRRQHELDREAARAREAQLLGDGDDAMRQTTPSQAEGERGTEDETGTKETKGRRGR